jgi:hypothetical protein
MVNYTASDLMKTRENDGTERREIEDVVRISLRSCSFLNDIEKRSGLNFPHLIRQRNPDLQRNFIQFFFFLERFSMSPSRIPRGIHFLPLRALPPARRCHLQIILKLALMKVSLAVSSCG